MRSNIIYCITPHKKTLLLNYIYKYRKFKSNHIRRTVIKNQMQSMDCYFYFLWTFFKNEKKSVKQIIDQILKNLNHVLKYKLWSLLFFPLSSFIRPLDFELTVKKNAISFDSHNVKTIYLPLCRKIVYLWHSFIFFL